MCPIFLMTGMVFDAHRFLKGRLFERRLCRFHRVSPAMINGLSWHQVSFHRLLSLSDERLRSDIRPWAGSQI